MVAVEWWLPTIVLPVSVLLGIAGIYLLSASGGYADGVIGLCSVLVSAGLFAWGLTSALLAAGVKR